MSAEAIRGAVNEWLTENPITLAETDPTVPLWAKQPITGAEVGQIIKVSAVDNSGTPTAWEPVDMPSGGGSSGGMSSTAAGLLVAILQSAVYATNISGKIERLKEALAAGTGDTDETTAEEITVTDGVMLIASVGTEITVSDGIMMIA